MSEPFVAYVESSLEDLIPAYLQHRAEDAVKIRDAVAAGDFETARSVGHGMKGSGGGYGFDHITAYGARIEQAAVAGEADTVLEAVELLEQYLSSVEIVYLDDEE